MSNLKFKKNESFYIRDGWFQKAINTISNTTENIFYKNEGIKYLGIGSNMVKGLKYWLLASNIIEPKNRSIILTDFGSLIYNYDKYLETNFVWYFIHYFLATNLNECPVIYGLFNYNLNTFTKNEAVEYLKEKFENIEPIKNGYIEDDVLVFIKSYYNDNKGDNPEDNYICPLSNLKLFIRKKDKYQKAKPLYSNLSYLHVYYAISQLFDYQDFDIDDSLYCEKSPLKIFNIDKNMYLQYLEEMKKNGLVNVVKTAGLNNVSFIKKLNITQIFYEYFGGVANV